MKTGHTEAAGWCLIASALRGERRVLAVVLGASSDAARASEAQKLLNWGFQAFDTVQLYQSGKQVTTLRVWKGAAPEVPAGFLADRYLTLPKGKADKLALTMQAQEPLVAPIARAQRVGTVKVALEGKPVAEFPMIALEDVPPASFFGRAWDTVRLWFQESADRPGARDDRRRPDRLPQRRSSCPLAEAQVSVLDRGFIYGDGVYELVPVYAPRAVPAAAASRAPAAQPRRHRPCQSAYRTRSGKRSIRDLVARQPFADQGVYFQVTRGVAKRDHSFPKGVRADGVHDEQSAADADARAGRATAWPWSPPTTTAGIAAT